MVVVGRGTHPEWVLQYVIEGSEEQIERRLEMKEINTTGLWTGFWVTVPMGLFLIVAGLAILYEPPPETLEGTIKRDFAARGYDSDLVASSCEIDPAVGYQGTFYTHDGKKIYVHYKQVGKSRFQLVDFIVTETAIVRLSTIHTETEE